jgi:hypothetical protein
MQALGGRAGLCATAGSSIQSVYSVLKDDAGTSSSELKCVVCCLYISSSLLHMTDV